MLLKDLDVSYGLKGKANYIFYMSEMEDTPEKGHFRKMDRSREVCAQLEKNMRDCRVLKYSDYNGDCPDAASIGIVFPAHSWGISLAVFAFLNHLRFSSGVYVYAVAVGEKISCESEDSIRRALRPLNQFKELFERRTRGLTSDFFVRCGDMKRSATEVPEDGRYHNKEVREELSQILDTMLFVSTEKLSDSKYVKDRSLTVSLADAEAMYESINMRARKRAVEKTYAERFGTGREAAPAKPALSKPTIHMGNIFLDENIFDGLRLTGVV